MIEITPEVFKHGMKELLLRCETPSANEEDVNLAIFEGAMLMCAVLSQVGYKEGSGLFIEMCKTASQSNNAVKSQN